MHVIGRRRLVLRRPSYKLQSFVLDDNAEKAKLLVIFATTTISPISAEFRNKVEGFVVPISIETNCHPHPPLILS